MERRTFLRGLGACLALPMLESLLPRRARAEDPLPPKRLLYYYVPNGFHMSQFTPASTGPAWQLSPILAPLADHKDDILVLSGLNNAPGNYQPGDELAGAHFQQTASFLSCRHVNKTPFQVGQSIDQVAAEAIGFVTPHRSLQLGLSQGGLTGNCGGNSWPCSYAGFISWADAHTPLALQTDPQALFISLFAPGALGSEEELLKRRAYKLKVLDVVHEDAAKLHQRLGVTDRQRLDKYLTSVNELEDKINASTIGLQCDPGELPPAFTSYTHQLELMLDVMVLAFECDVTRIISFMTHSGGASHYVPYDWVQYNGVPIQDSFHTVSHHGMDPTNLGKIQAINTWEIAAFASLLARMKAVTDVDGSSLLDNSIAFFSSEVSDGDSHSADNLPIIVAGRGGGTILPGRHLSYTAPNNVYADLHIALLHAFGIPIASFGDDGTGPLEGLSG